MSLQVVSPSPRGLITLTAEQERAAAPTDGVTVVVGGPGTGKSVVAVAAAARRVQEGSSLERIVLLTHSRTAAQGLRRDLARRLGGSHTNSQVTTIHGLALGLLRRYWPQGDSPWRLLRAPEQEQRIRELLAGMPEEAWPESIRGAIRTRAFARQLREVLARARQLSLDPEALARLANEAGDPVFAAAAGFMEGYLTVGDFSGTLDYAELVYRTRLLLTEPDVAAGIRASFDAVIVDDAQELDHAQTGLLSDFAGLGVPLLALGDPRSRIGGYRGASRTALASLARLPGARQLDLAQDQRHTPQLRRVLARLAARIGGPPAPGPADDRLADGDAPGEAVAVRVFDDESAELAAVASELRAAVVRDGLAWSDLVVIARAGRAQVGSIAKELIRLGVPVDVAGDELALAEQPAVATLLMALGVAAAGGVPRGDESRRLLSSPLCGLDGVGQRQLGRQLVERHRELGTSDVLLARTLSEPGLLDGIDSEPAERARQLAGVLGAASGKLARGAETQEALWQLWDATDWPERLRAEALRGSRRANADLHAVVELFDLAARMTDLKGVAGARTFQAEVSGQEIPADTGRELDLEGRGVRVVTAHRTRGLEWEAAWIVGVQEGLWPQLSRAGVVLDPERLGPDLLAPAALEPLLANERHLFYVACSRARSLLRVSAVQGREGEGGRPSRFLSELGIAPERIHGRPPRLLSAAALVGRLRERLADPEASPGLRRAAATRLAGLAAVTSPDGRPAFPGAAPGQWWGVWGSTPERGGGRELTLTGSALEALLDCPRRWFLARRAAAEGGRRSRAAVGDVVHLLAKQAAVEGLDSQALRARLDEVWDRIPFETEWLSATERVEIDEALDRFDRYHHHASGQLLGVEVSFAVTVRVAGRRIKLTGTVDRLERDLDGRLRIVDLKTGRRPLTEAAVAEHPQLGLYQVAARAGAFDALVPGERRVAPPVLAFLRVGEALPLLVAQPSIDDQPTLKGHELEVGPTWVHDKLDQAARLLETGRFDATESKACRYCQFTASCPALAGAGGRR